MKYLIGIKILALLACFNISVSALAQTKADSLEKTKRDAALTATQEKGTALLQQADSTHLVDSLQQVQLRMQIEELKASDARKKEALQKQLDLLKLAQAERNKRIKEQVDSLRANTEGIPVMLFRDTLFYIYSKLGPFSPTERAQNIQRKLEVLADRHAFVETRLMVFPGEESYDIMHDQMIVMSITDRDAFWLDMPKQQVADEYTLIIKQSVSDYYKDTSLGKTLFRIGMILLVILILVLIIIYLNKGFNRFIKWITRKSHQHIYGIKIKNYEFLSAERELQFGMWLLNALKALLILFLVYLSLPIIFSIFPSTEGVAKMLIGYIVNPLKSIFWGFIGYIPELITILVIGFVTNRVIRFLKFLTGEIESGKLHIEGFYPDWAMPTFSLVRIIISAFAFIVIFPYLPGSDSTIFRGVSVFFGLVISLGSQSAISNIIAGLVITYMRAFKVGDRVKIGETTGDVMDKTMLVTRIRTIKNEDVTIPNSAILSGHTVNYSTSAKTLGLILNTTVTIGYDAPWKKVHELLINAALKTQDIKQEPKPFVLQTSLDDFYVSYQINAFTEKAENSATIYSELHSNIQDAFNEAGVEIMSPHYRAARDGNQTTIPADYLSKDYQTPAFRIKNTDKKT
ncbi:MAG: mechanosensitive ion channel family protein [Chitinophagales bacterium]|nr:mechanosensitive ion channel family protein [Chitinophagales bacterium]